MITQFPRLGVLTVLLLGLAAPASADHYNEPTSTGWTPGDFYLDRDSRFGAGFGAGVRHGPFPLDPGRFELGDTISFVDQEDSTVYLFPVLDTATAEIEFCRFTILPNGMTNFACDLLEPAQIRD